MHLIENAFESGERKVIPAVLVYLRKSECVLMIHRNAKNSGKVDYHQGKWNGLGGKCEKDESPLEAAIRETWEEAGIRLLPEQLKALGVLQFPNFKPHKNEDWIVFVFTGSVLDTGQLTPCGAEGDLHWIPVKDLDSLNLWPGDRLFVPSVIRGQPFMGTIWYEDQKVKKSWIKSLAE